MPEYKNQHYVPQHLLRGWTDDEKVAVYNLDNQKEYPRTSISNLCSEDYFYGGPDIEKSMGGVEQRHAEIINKLRKTRSFNVLGRMDILHFCVLVLLQRNRTKQRKHETEELIDNLAKEYLELKVEAGEVDPELSSGRNVLDVLNDYKITHESPLAFPMLQALTGVDLIIDLEVAIIENKSDKGFVVSDHPVIHDNLRFKNGIDRHLVGLQNRGLQIFMPISDEVLVMLYDSESYSVEYCDEEKRRVSITSEKVVSGLNDVQLISAFENIFYRERGREQEFKDAQHRLEKYIEDDTIIFERLTPEEHDFDTDNEIVESGFNLPDYSPYLPFVRLRMDTEFAIRRRPYVSKHHREYVNGILEDARGQAGSN